MLSKEWHILGDLNINLYQNGSVLGEENTNIIKDADSSSHIGMKDLEKINWPRFQKDLISTFVLML